MIGSSLDVPHADAVVRGAARPPVLLDTAGFASGSIARLLDTMTPVDVVPSGPVDVSAMLSAGIISD